MLKGRNPNAAPSASQTAWLKVTAGRGLEPTARAPRWAVPVAARGLLRVRGGVTR